MGQEISHSQFTAEDFSEFSQRLKQETEILKSWFENALFSQRPLTAGLELEAWLIDSNLRPAAKNEAFFQLAKSDYLTPELAKYNIELNVDPVALKQSALQHLETDLQQHWQYCRQVAHQLDCEVLAIGILPTLKDSDLTLESMSVMERYRALNEQVLRNRQGRPIELHIVGRQSLQSTHYDVMLEAAATSLQIHLQVPQTMATSYYNTALLLSAPLVAASANSPFLFGKNLWEESRIPVFEQAVETGGFEAVAQGPLRRVGFGSGFARQSLMECFNENQDHFPILLPTLLDENKQLNHLRLHNGTIWRWNRPLIGFDDDGTPHLRIEHRVIPSGPSTRDEIANVALFYGLAYYYAEHDDINENRIEFAIVKDNFYNAARHGIDARITWLDGKRYTLRQLILEQLLPQAEIGLQELTIDDKAIDDYLSIIEQRVQSGQTGSRWQQVFVETHGDDMVALTRCYLDHQLTGRPVHEWDV